MMIYVFELIEAGYCPDCDERLDEQGYCGDCHIIPSLDMGFQSWLREVEWAEAEADNDTDKEKRNG